MHPDKKTTQATPWLARLMTPMIARLVAREMVKKYQVLTPTPSLPGCAPKLIQAMKRNDACWMRSPAGDIAMTLGSPVWALLLLIALKISFDLKAHIKEQAKVIF